MKIGYARVSRQDQNTNLQRDALLAAGCIRIFEDRMTGATFERQGLKAALAALRPGSELVVWKLDRLGRSMLETVSVVIDLDRRGIGFHSLTESLDTKTPIGRGVLAFMAAIAEDERDRIRERTRAGLAAARRRGRRLGRPPKLSSDQLGLARKMLGEERKTRAQVAAHFGVDVTTLRKALRG